MVESKAFLSLVTWLVRVAGSAVLPTNTSIAREAVGGAQQAIDDLPLAALAVTAVTELGEWTAAAFQVARRHVVEHQRAAGEMAFGKGRLDSWLAPASQSRAL